MIDDKEEGSDDNVIDEEDGIAANEKNKNIQMTLTTPTNVALTPSWQRTMHGMVNRAADASGTGTTASHATSVAAKTMPTTKQQPTKQFAVTAERAKTSTKKPNPGVARIAYMVIKSNAAISSKTFLDRMQNMTSQVRKQKPRMKKNKVMMPNDPEILNVKKRKKAGIPLDVDTAKKLKILSNKFKINLKFLN